MKKILIGCLITLTIGNLTGCTNKKVNNEINTITNEVNTTTSENSENQETNKTNTTTEKNTENQEINETEDYKPEFVIVNYNDEGVYLYKIIRCNQYKAKELEEYIKSSGESANVTLTFANDSELNGNEYKYGENGEYCFIRMINGDRIETYDVLEIKPMESLKTEQAFEEEYKEKCFKIDYIGSNKSSTITVIKCTEEEIQYIERTKFEAHSEILATNEVNNNLQGIIGNYGSTGEKAYIKLFSGNDSCYYKVIE